MNHYFLTEEQKEFIKLLINENFSPSFGGMLKRVLREKKYNETERTRLKEIRNSYIKKRIKSKYDFDKLNETINDINLNNTKLIYIDKLFKDHIMNDNSKKNISDRFDKCSTLKSVLDTYNMYKRILD